MTAPQRARFLTARWSNLVMANYVVNPAVLQRYVPRGTELDLWGGRAFVSVVGFLFLNTRVLNLPVPFHQNFEEVNLRFYVRRVVAGEVRRGVVFIKEVVPRRLLAWVARTVYNENYVALPMTHEDRMSQSPRAISYSWKHGGAWSRLGAVVTEEWRVPADGTEEAFVTEHYWGYTAQRDGSTLEYQVEHPRWSVARCSSSEFQCDVETLYGAEFVPFLTREPSSCFVAAGSDVVVRFGTRVAS